MQIAVITLKKQRKYTSNPGRQARWSWFDVLDASFDHRFISANISSLPIWPDAPVMLGAILSMGPVWVIEKKICSFISGIRQLLTNWRTLLRYCHHPDRLQKVLWGTRAPLSGLQQRSLSIQPCPNSYQRRQKQLVRKILHLQKNHKSGFTSQKWCCYDKNGSCPLF